jgi:hypothetical protein
MLKVITTGDVLDKDNNPHFPDQPGGRSWRVTGSEPIQTKQKGNGAVLVVVKSHQEDGQ